MYTTQIEKIKRRLGVTGSDKDDILNDLFEDTLNTALSFCNIDNISAYRKSESVFAIVCESVCGLYNQRGNEGKLGYSMGGQGATYDTIYDTMKKKLIQAGCRVWK